jgi:hypothetical protein
MKIGVLAFMPQNTRERSFGVVTRERISIAMEPYSHKIEELDRNLESAIGASRADVRGFLEVCKVRNRDLGVYVYGRGLYEEDLRMTDSRAAIGIILLGSRYPNRIPNAECRTAQ